MVDKKIPQQAFMSAFRKYSNNITLYEEEEYCKELEFLYAGVEII